MPASAEATPVLPDLSPICGRPIEARFDGGLMSSDGGLLVLRQIEQRLGIAGRLAACMHDPRAPERIAHGLDEIIRFRMLMIAAGYEDGNDADTLRADPLFKLSMDRLPDHRDLCSQSTVSRAENLPDRHALLRMGRAMVDHSCQSFRQVPRRIVLDIDDTFDAVHGVTARFVRNCTLSGPCLEREANIAERAEADGWIGVGPDIVAGQRDVLPAERGDMSHQVVRQMDALGAEMLDGAVQIDRVPVDDGRG